MDFIQRLTKEDILEFAKNLYPPDTHISVVKAINTYGGNYFILSIAGDEYSRNIRFENFMATENNRNWINYLAKKFPEYRKAYMTQCEKIFD